MGDPSLRELVRPRLPEMARGEHVTGWTLCLVSALATVIAMELWAALLHGRIWHGLLWKIHRSHHRRRQGGLEANDALSLLHAPVAAAVIVLGCRAATAPACHVLLGIGAGMTVFGIAYLLVHDGLVHGRLPVEFLARWSYLARVREAHLIHHARGREPYGLFLGPWALARAELRLTGSRPRAPQRQARARSRGTSARSPSD